VWTVGGGLFERVSGGVGSDAELVVVVVTSLVLFMIATCLLIKGQNAWHAVAGILIGLTSALYLLAVADVVSVESILDGSIWPRALRLVGLR